MEKILIAINVASPSTVTLDFASYLARLTNSRLTGIFFDLATPSAHLPVASVASDPQHVWKGVSTNPESEVLLHEMKSFGDSCAARGVTTDLHYTTGDPVDELVAESRFADMIVLDPEFSFNERKEGVPSECAKKILAKSECPVMIAPYSFDGIDEIVFAYDGSRSSVYAIKLFSYLLPHLASKKLTIVSVKDEDTDQVIEKDKVMELLKRHYTSVAHILLQGKPSDELFGYLLGKKNIMVVMGAFGRTMISGFFRNSTANLVIKVTNLPVFIAHH